MDDEQKQLKTVSRANKARAALENESIVSAFDYVEKELFDRWKICESQDGRDRIWIGIGIMTRVKEVLALAIRNGTVAKSILDKIENERRKAA